jgi:hypothetical protein
MVARLFTFETKPLMNMQILSNFVEEKDRALSAMDEMDDDNSITTGNNNELLCSNISNQGSNIYVVSYRRQTSFSRKMSFQFEQLENDLK